MNSLLPFPRFGSGQGLEPTLARFEQWMQAPDSPVRSVKHLPATEGEYAAIPDSIDATLREALARRGIARLYSHQAEALRALDRIVAEPEARSLRAELASTSRN